MIRPSLRHALIPAGLALLLAASVPAPSLAAESAESSQPAVGTPILMDRQEPLLAASDRIREAAGSAGPGFAGLTIDPDRSALHLYWHGALPAAVRDLNSSLSTPEVRVHVRSAPYSLARLEYEAHRVLETAATGGGRVVSAAPLPDGTGLRVRVEGGRRTASDAPATGVPAAGVPVTVEHGPGPRPAGRATDATPVTGGALIISEAETCTVGFGVVERRTGQRRLLTAGHCGAVGSPWYNGDGEYIGNAVARHPAADALVVAADGSGKVWHGAVTENLDGVDEVARRVSGSRSPVVGQYVCASGAVSGTHCGLKVTKVGVVLTIGGVKVPHQVEAEQTAREAAAGNGDSGGPVYSGRGKSGRVTAHGMISAYDRQQPVACTGLPSGTGRACSWRVYFTDIRPLLKTTGTRLARTP